MTDRKTSNRKGAELIERLLTPQELTYVAGAIGSTEHIQCPTVPPNYSQKVEPDDEVSVFLAR